MMNKKKLGSEGENAVAEFLEDKGFVILEKNFLTKYGEIDIIAEFKGTVHFVEVKTRTSFKYGTPAMAVNAAKQSKIIKTAECYITGKKLFDAPCSFDVAEVFTDKGKSFRINFIESAFET